MKKIIFSCIFLTIGINSYCQKFYISPNFGAQFATLSYAKGSKADPDFTVPRPKLLGTYGIGFYLNQGGLTHRLSLQSLALGINFRVSTATLWKYDYQYNGIMHMSSIDQFLISYSLQKEATRMIKFIGKSKSKLKYALGVGFGTNESQFYFTNRYQSNNYYGEFDGDFYGYDYKIKKDGYGIFLMPEVGFDLFNKKGKRFLSFDFFYYKGLKNMITYDLHYYYGNTVNNTRVDRNLLVGTRGTVFGLKVGIPIRVIKDN